MSQPVIFNPDTFNPTDLFQSVVLNPIEANDINAPAAAAGVLATFTSGSDFVAFAQCLRANGLTDAGFLELIAACVANIQENAS